MGEKLRVTLVANAGLLLEYQGTRLLIDGIYGAKGHPFSNLRPEIWQAMLYGAGAFQKIDYLLFTHAHPDHFSPKKTLHYLKERTVKGIFLPQTPSVEESGLKAHLQETRTPAVFLSDQTDHAVYRIEPNITVRAFGMRHLDKQYYDVPHFCYLLTFGEQHYFFSADVDYVGETLSQLQPFPLRAAFVNPLFFSALRRKRFFKGELKAETICIYHVPFSGEDPMGVRERLAREMVAFSPEQDVCVLCDSMQRIDL